MITKGRIVLVRYGGDERTQLDPMVGIVVCVHGDPRTATSVNVAVWDSVGNQQQLTSVCYAERADGLQVLAGEDAPRDGDFAVPAGASWCALVPRT